MKITLDLEPSLVWKLGDIAAREKVTASEIVTHLITGGQTVTPQKTFDAIVRRLVLMGWDDGSISVRVKEPRNRVAQARRRAGLKPNRKK